MTRLFIDADACPVKAECYRVATRLRVEVLVVSNGGIRPDPNPLIRLVIVPDGPDEADKWIAEEIGTGDLCVTSDIPLADRCLKAGARALRPNGDPFTAANIGHQLAMRDLQADLRAADPFRQGGGKPFGKADRSRFLDALDRQLRGAIRDAGNP
ncbi:YaiI/YqxD family protein [Oceanomicrobium pacificus]|uniref:UPF0178 protein GSH16_05675 n=1 Tax=Oceanomicrobium pacificus TaxID=2692916 RepID=A0A6B0TM00_9RHOB|nr:YaiI/YqxD family protein [Oceanomicrobium pacificus]MXU64926.1 YaiI/YqxD family protein [Oceanomicrobium pacificus]